MQSHSRDSAGRKNTGRVLLSVIFAALAALLGYRVALFGVASPVREPRQEPRAEPTAATVNMERARPLAPSAPSAPSAPTRAIAPDPKVAIEELAKGESLASGRGQLSVIMAIMPVMSDIEACRKARVERTPDAPGAADLVLEVTPDRDNPEVGVVDAVRLDGDQPARDEVFEACVLDAVRDLPLPQPSKPREDVRMPLYG
jgi:hypothetical protein